MLNSLEEWAEKILDDYNFHTGYQLASDWQKKHGPLPIGKRLAPKRAFVLGGDFHVDNLYAADSFDIMSYRGMLAQKIKDLPDGTTIKVSVGE